MKDLINAKLFLKNNKPRCEAYNCSKSNKSNPEKTLFTLLKNKKSMDSCFKLKRGHSCANLAHYSQINQPFTECSSNVIVLLCMT